MSPCSSRVSVSLYIIIRSSSVTSFPICISDKVRSFASGLTQRLSSSPSGMPGDGGDISSVGVDNAEDDNEVVGFASWLSPELD